MSQVVTGRNPSDRGADSEPREEGVAAEGEVETETVLGTVSRPCIPGTAFIRTRKLFLTPFILSPRQLNRLAARYLLWE